MFIDPNELSEETMDDLIDLTMECFVQSLGFLNDIGDDMQLIKFIRHAYETYELSVMVDIPHPEWWPDHDMYSDAENLDSSDTCNANAQSAESNAPYAEPNIQSVESSAPNVEPQPQSTEPNAANSDLPEDFDTADLSLNDFIELSVVATPPADENQDEDAEQVVLASILLPNVYLERLDQVSNDQMMSSIELQWLPERNTLDD